ncbi:hypothetical protein ABH931_001595 [Streptacidiphilus sp. MAP12-33]
MVRQWHDLRRSIPKTWCMAPTVLLFAMAAPTSAQAGYSASPMCAASLIGPGLDISIAVR